MFTGGRRGALGVGFASGPERIFEATSDAIAVASETSLSTASGNQVHAQARGDAKAVLASHHDERMGAFVRVIVVAAI